MLKKIFKKKEKKQLKLKDSIIYNMKSLLIALGVALIIRSLLIQAFYIPSSSMKPNLLIGDYLFVSKISYGYNNKSLPFNIPLLPHNKIFYTKPLRGDIVVFKYQHDNTTDIVKRLIGLPGDKIQVINSIVYINDLPLSRKFIGIIEHEGVLFNVYKETMPNGVSYNIWQIKGASNYPAQYYAPYTLKEDEFFMMGDNRDMSKDSRFDGPVLKNNLLGKPMFIFFSINGSFLQVWKWATEIRWKRIFKPIK